MKVVVVSHGDVDEADREHLVGADVVIAVDGGALALERWRASVTMIVGDLDSLSRSRAERLAGADGVEEHPAAKESSDTELAIERAVSAGADEIVVLGALGGPRLDHELANVLLVAAGLAPARIRLVRGGTSVRALRGPGELALDASVGDLVTLLPVGADVAGVRSRGLRYGLAGEGLAFGRSRGLSNEVVERPAAVSCDSGTLLVIETRR